MNLFKFPKKIWNYVGAGIIFASVLLLGSCSSAPSTTGDQGSMDVAREKADEAKAMAEELNAQKLFPSQYEMGEGSYTEGVDLGVSGNFQGGTDSFVLAEQFYMESYEMAMKAKEEAEEAIKKLVESIKETEAAASEAIRNEGA